jgi:Ca-activated chloride channel family protein
LDKLAESNRGARDYVGAGEDIEVKVSALYQKVAKPAMTDVRLEWRGVEVSEFYPRPVGDLFYGGELVLMGRFHGGGKGTLAVTGKAAGKPVRFEYPVTFHEESGGESFLPRLWANRKVAHELDGIRLTGKADPEVVNTIVKLAKRYGIVTPYTSFLITEEGAGAGNLMGARQMEAMRRDAFDSGFSGGGVVAARAQKTSLALSAFRGAAMSAPGAAGAAAAGMETETRNELKDQGIAAVATRTVGAKTFYFRHGCWEDGALDESKGFKTRSVRYLSDEYFELLKRHPGIGQYLSLGARVAVVVDGTAYRIGE